MTTNLEIHNAKQQSKDYTINVDNGLSILVKSTGSKLWRFRYSFSGKRCMISLGKYPQISIKQARAKQREYMDMLEQGTNPSTHRQVQKAKLTTEKDFRAVTLEWHTKHSQHSNERHNKLALRRLENTSSQPLANFLSPVLKHLCFSISLKQFKTKDT